MRRIGMAGGAAYFFETVAFAALAQMAGLLGPTPLAAYTILHNIEALVFMIALGAVGGDGGPGRPGGRAPATPVEARFAGFAGLAMATGARRARRAPAARLRPGRRRLLQRRSRR